MTFDALMRLRKRAHALWTARLQRMLARQRVTGLAGALADEEWRGLVRKVRRAEARMTRVRTALRAHGWPTKGPGGSKAARRR